MERYDFVVTEPPTSGEVEELAYRMLSTGGLLPLIVSGSNQKLDSITMHINQRSGNDDGSIAISGRIVDSDTWVNLHLDSDKQAPATGYIE